MPLAFGLTVFFHTDVEADTPGMPDAPATAIDGEKVLPWQGRDDIGPGGDRSVSHYLGYYAPRRSPSRAVKRGPTVPAAEVGEASGAARGPMTFGRRAGLTL